MLVLGLLVIWMAVCLFAVALCLAAREGDDAQQLDLAVTRFPQRPVPAADAGRAERRLWSLPSA